MLLEFSIKNFRSIKEKAEFSFVAESSKSKPENVFTHKLINKDETRLLKSAVLYGANASGKSNVLRGLYNLLMFIKQSSLSAGEPIHLYDPFRFDTISKLKPTEYTLTFTDDNGLKYKYEVIFDHRMILKEELDYFPNGKTASLFSRHCGTDPSNFIHKVVIGAESRKRTIEVFSNKLALQVFGTDIPNQEISKVHAYLQNFKVLNSLNPIMFNNFQREVMELIDINPALIKYLSCLVRFADTKIEEISLMKLNESEFNFPENISIEEKNSFIRNNMYQVFGHHYVYDKNKIIGLEKLSLREESQGTRTLFGIGGKIFDILNSGGVLIIDELNTSLHPYLTKLLVMLFQNEKLNPRNAQLLFTTHDTNILDRTLFRKDQVWFTEKNDLGESVLYSLQDFDDVREDTPFDKWYMAGKFGALPVLGSFDKLCNDATK